VPAEAQIAVAWQGNHGRERAFFIAGDPKLVFGPPLLRELEPLAPWGAVIVPVKSRMRAQDLDTTTNDKRQEKKIEKVCSAQP